MNPYGFTGRVAVLTGAAGGIGEHLAYGLAARGSDLILVDHDEARLDQVADRLACDHPGREVRTIVADLADRSAVEAVAAQVRAWMPPLGLLINNAGVALGGRFDQVTVDEFEHVMNVNFRAPMLLTHGLLPALKAGRGSHLVNVSSLFGLIAPAGQCAYSASKFALRGLSQALREELAEDRIGVTTVHPGGVRTRIADNARAGSGVPAADVEPHREMFARLLTYPPEKAARQILDGVAKRKARVLIAPSAKAPDLLARLFPVAHARILRLFMTAAATRNRPAQPSPQPPALLRPASPRDRFPVTSPRPAPPDFPAANRFPQAVPRPAAPPDHSASTTDRAATRPADRTATHPADRATTHPADPVADVSSHLAADRTSRSADHSRHPAADRPSPSAGDHPSPSTAAESEGGVR